MSLSYYLSSIYGSNEQDVVLSSLPMSSKQGQMLVDAMNGLGSVGKNCEFIKRHIEDTQTRLQMDLLDELIKHVEGCLFYAIKSYYSDERRMNSKRRYVSVATRKTCLQVIIIAEKLISKMKELKDLLLLLDEWHELVKC